MAETLDPSPEELREFLDAEKACPDPVPEVQQRVFSRLATTLALDGADAPDTSVPDQPTMSPGLHGRSLLARGITRGWATFLVGAAVGATTYGTVQHLRHKPESPAPPAPLVAPQPPLAAPELPPLPEPPAPPAPSAQARPSGDGRSAESKDARLSAERNLLEISRTALGRGKIDWALVALRRHARLYPNGQLAEERDGLMVQALVGKGDYVQARERATRFHRQHPHSLFAPAVDQALQSIP